MAELRIQFGDFQLDEGAGELLLRGSPVKIQPKPFGLLVHLMRNRDRVVSKRELLDTLWPNISVSDLALFSALRDLRRALGDTDTAERTIRTVRGQGFRFVEQVAPVSRPAPAPSLAGQAQSSAPPALAPPAPHKDFVDRADAMATLLGSLTAARAGELRVSFITGAAGIGKTRLSLELAREALSLDVESHVGRCIDREGSTPYWPWLQIMRGLLMSPRTQASAQAICAEHQELAQIAELALPTRALASADLNRAEARLRFFDAVGLLLVRVSQAQPLLLVIDDLQWADEASLLLLDYLITALHGARIHLVATLRDPPRPERTLARVLATSARETFAERIDLQGLGREAVRMLLESASAKIVAPAVVDSVLAATAGNALFVSELAKLTVHGELDVTDLAHGLPVPQRVRDLLRWQFDRLSPPCQSVLQLLSVAGGDLELSVLVRAAEQTNDVVLESLSESEAVGLVVAALDPAMRVAFAHDLVRESVYRDLSIAVRARLHRRLAEALEATTLRSPNADVTPIAHHYALGVADGGAQSAVRFCHLAGQQANARLAYEDAVVHYDRALRAFAMIEQPDPKLGCEILLAQAEAAWGTSEDAATVQQRFVVAADAARAARQAELFARAALGRSGHGVGPGDFREVLAIDLVDIALLTEASEVLGATATELRALVLARLALALRYAEPFHVADELSVQAVRIAEANARPEALAEVLRYRHEVLSGPQHARERVRLAERILTLARTVRSRPLEIDALTFQTRDCLETLDFAGSYTAGVAVNALEANMKHPGMHFRGGMRRVSVKMFVGELDVAESLARRFYERDAARNIGALGTFDLQMAMLATLRGDHDAALRAFGCIGVREPNVAWVDCAIARELARSGEHAGARARLQALARDGYRRITDQHELATLGAFLMLAEACAELGEAAYAPALYDHMLPFEDMIAAPFLAAVWQGSIAHGLGLLASVLDRPSDAERHFERALSIANGLRSPPLIAITSERVGALLLVRNAPGDRKRGLELVMSAGEIAERIGMKLVARGCSQLLRLHGRGSSPSSLPHSRRN